MEVTIKINISEVEDDFFEAGCYFEVDPENPLKGARRIQDVNATLNLFLNGPPPATTSALAFQLKVAPQGCPYRLVSDTWVAFKIDRDKSPTVGERAPREPREATEPSSPSRREPVTAPTLSAEEQAWKKAKEANTRKSYQDFLDDYPASEYTREAREELTWLIASEKDDISAYESFLDRYRSSRHRTRAREKILAIRATTSIEYTLLSEASNGDEFSYRFSNLIGTPTFTYDTTAVKIVEEQKEDDQRYQVVFNRLQNANDFTVVVCDNQKDEDKRCIKIELGQALDPSISAEDPKVVSFTLRNGVRPYIIQFNDTSGVVRRRFTLHTDPPPAGWVLVADTEGEQIWTIDRATLYTELGNAGTYQVVIRDQSGFKEDDPAKLPPLTIAAPSLPVSPELIGGVLGGMALLLLVTGLVRRQRRRRAEEALRQARAEAPAEAPGGAETTSNTAPAETEKDGNDSGDPQPEAPEDIQIKQATLGAPKEKGDFVIARRQRAARGPDFSLLQQPEAYLPLPMSQLWTDTVVNRVHLHRDLIYELDDFLRTHNTNKIKEQESGIPEIGGMLMGTYRHQDGQYEVAVDKFIPIQSNFQNVYQLEFSAESIGTDLGLIQDKYPQLVLVGWFHTHPGHGLFLSKPDLRIQRGFFRQPFQFAMEIDSLSEDLDTGFFTWRQDGAINNTERFQDESPWFSWSEIEKFTRKRHA